MSALSITLGFAVCGSFCTFESVFSALEGLQERYETIIPIMSEISSSTDTRFGTAAAWKACLSAICGRPIIQSIAGAEPIGPKKLLDALVVAPCTGNTLAKIAAGITDSCVSMACKAHLRNGRPLILAVSSNDALGVGAKNLGELLVRKNVYFVPFRQDDPLRKPRSLVADFSLIGETVDAALRGEQLQPLLLPHP